MQTITREYGFDAGHRVMNERFKCFNAHGHRYHIKLTYSFQDMHEIGYIIDFKEIKRVGVQWIDDMMDHGFIVNPHDTLLINTLIDIETKLVFVIFALSNLYGLTSMDSKISIRLTYRLFIVSLT